MTDARCPEPKPVFIVLLALAGAVSGVAWVLIYQSKPPAVILPFCAALGGALGLAIGVSAAISARRWVQLLSSPVLGFAAWLVAYVSYFGLVFNNDFPILDQMWQSGLEMAVPVALSLAAADEALLSARMKNKSIWVWAILHPALAGSGCVLGLMIGSGARGDAEPMSPELLFFPLAAFAAFGLLHFLGMLAALAVDRRMHRGAERNLGQEQV